MDLAGKLLIAMPGHGRPALRPQRDPDLRPFRRGRDGAGGEQAVVRPEFFGSAGSAEHSRARRAGRDIRVHFGGPVERGRGLRAAFGRLPSGRGDDDDSWRASG